MSNCDDYAVHGKRNCEDCQHYHVDRYREECAITGNSITLEKALVGECRQHIGPPIYWAPKITKKGSVLPERNRNCWNCGNRAGGYCSHHQVTVSHAIVTVSHAIAFRRCEVSSETSDPTSRFRGPLLCWVPRKFSFKRIWQALVAVQSIY